ncbi:MAG: MBL fold metallo-hydrolase [Acidobacteriota bacterium]
MKIHTLDLEFQGVSRAVAAYLIIAPAGPVLVETGPASTLPTLLDRLRDLGLQPPDIGHILLTHIHLDHAGAAGWWTRQGARIHVHPRGARHLIDPARLLGSAERIYGDRMESLWGTTEPALPEQVTTVEDEEVVEVGGLRFQALETPGHARHHHTYRLGDLAFTGDVAGLRLPGSNLIALPAPPPEFDLEAWLESISRLERLPLSAIFPTHVGRQEGLPQHWAGLRELLQQSTRFVRQRMEAGMERDDLVEEYRHWNGQRALQAGLKPEIIHQYSIANPLDMSVDGIMRYWRKRLLDQVQR